MNVNYQLLPCPFCGGEAMLQHIKQKGANFDGRYIDCVRCGTSTNLMFSVKEDCIPMLREKWNRREAASSTQNKWAPREEDCAPKPAPK